MDMEITKSTRLFLSRIGRKGGEAISPKKQSASRENGKTGGRPMGRKDSHPRKRNGKKKSKKMQVLPDTIQ